MSSSFTLFANSGAPGGVYLSWKKGENIGNINKKIQLTV
jgi:hypothetical protein